MSLFLAVLPFAFALAACSKSSSSDGPGASETLQCDANAGERNPGIFGGRRAHKDSWIGRGVVAILTEEGGGVELCTGSLIDRNIVLTAAHCVSRMEIASRTQVMFSVEPVCDVKANNRSALQTVSAVRVHRGYGTTRGGGDDIAMIRLTNPAPWNYGTLKLVGRVFEMKSDTPILLTGYGKRTDYNTNAAVDPHDLKYTYVKPYSGSDLSKSLLPLASAPVLYFDQRGGSGACAGDSGGPALARNDAGEYRVIGVASQVDNLDQPDFTRQEEVTCRIGIAHTSVANYATWIESTFSELRNSDTIRSRAIDD